MATEISQSPSQPTVRLSDNTAWCEMTARRRFRYLADPICVSSMVLYCLTRWLLKPHHIGGWLVHDYLNDLLCLPIFLPIILRVQRLLRLRTHDRPPTLLELLHNWLVFSILYELILPRLSMFRSTADPWDAAAYLTGGLLAYTFWHRRSFAPARFRGYWNTKVITAPD